MDEDDGDTPCKGRPAKRAIVISPSSERSLPQAQRARRSSVSREPARILFMFGSPRNTDYHFRTSVVRVGSLAWSIVCPRVVRRSWQQRAQRVPSRRSTANPHPTGHSTLRCRRCKPKIRSQRHHSQRRTLQSQKLLGGAQLRVSPYVNYTLAALTICQHPRQISLLKQSSRSSKRIKSNLARGSTSSRHCSESSARTTTLTPPLLAIDFLRSLRSVALATLPAPPYQQHLQPVLPQLRPVSTSPGCRSIRVPLVHQEPDQAKARRRHKVSATTFKLLVL